MVIDILQCIIVLAHYVAKTNKICNGSRTQNVYRQTQVSSWRVVLYQQWVGNTEQVLAGYSYIHEAQAARNPNPEDITLIEITCNQPCDEESRVAVDAARFVLVGMFRE